MHLSAVRAFVSVCDRGSFRAAAEHLHLTQPAISKRIAALELRLGHPLFDRIGRRVLPTAAGVEFLPHARRLLLDMDDAQRALDDLGRGVGGRLGLALSHHVGLHRMPPVLRRYTAAYPQVKIDIHFLASEQACRAIARGELELAVITLPDPPIAGLDQTELWRDPLCAAVSPDHPLARIEAPTPADLAAWPALLPEPETYTYKIVARALARHGLALQVRQSSTDLETLKMLTTAGLGWSALPATMLDGDLHALQIADLTMVRRLGSVRHPARHRSRAAAALLAFLAEQPAPK